MATKFTNINTGAVTVVPLDLGIALHYPQHPRLLEYFEITIPRSYIKAELRGLNVTYCIEFEEMPIPLFDIGDKIYGRLHTVSYDDFQDTTITYKSLNPHDISKMEY